MKIEESKHRKKGDEENKRHSGLSSREKIPIYATSIGWASGRSSIFTFLSYFGVVLGASPLEQSILTSVRNLGSNLFQSIWGWLADLKGRKLVILIGLSTLSLTVFLTPFVPSPFELVLISLIMTSIGFSIIPAWNAFLGDYSSEKTRASFIGFVNSIGTWSSLILIILLGLLMDSTPFPFPSDISLYPNSRPVFFIPFIGGSIVFAITIVIALFLREKYVAHKRVVIDEEISHSWRTLIDRNQPFKRLLPINSFFKFCMSMAWPIFPFVMLSVAESWFQVAIMWAVFNVPRGFGQSIGGRLADKYNKKIVLTFSRFGYAVVPFGYALGLITGNVWFLILVNIPGGFAFGAEDTSIASYALDCSTAETRARYYSILLTFEGVFAFAGSLFAGLSMEFLLGIAGITYQHPDFHIVLIILLLLITGLRLLSASLHKFVYKNPLDFNLETNWESSTQ
ncbi:MAG: MFS transporter [Candidatus Heimdallarchaeota archaeon]|nr:MFS transporter [Candidatus Heimdallarchaeota archaeon]